MNVSSHNIWIENPIYSMSRPLASGLVEQKRDKF